ncbi:RCC1 domain-containing protein [Deinococcus soli (ex Cha et al. 2016)]|uniref:RCC1 domain-containing protein n=1 Tax=Deinococcus soli (ex Cha et al. 2016) TaxID=1309411 RepID=UPI0016682D90|nr:hypothetical protein [Deinococcus soli (ex Cha et al. 2016)]GGB81795.1 hypothetical protein GCM10008019_42520 [Deinococcus soli (ex Cha et al. 2016)]
MRTPLLLTTLTLLLAACGQPTPTAAAPTPDRLLGSVELPVTTAAVSGQALTFREGDVQITRLGAASVQSAGGFDYLRAQYEVKNVGTTPFNNLTLVAVAKSANIGKTAIKTITSFGGASSSDQAGLVKLSVPTHAISLASDSTLSLVSGAEGLQAFTTAETASLTTQPGWNTSYGPGDAPLNYGFVLNRTCSTVSTCTRLLEPGASGTINVAMRIPKGSSTAYNFVMNFAIVDQDVTRVTRSVVPAESLSSAEARLTSITNGVNPEIMQVGLNRMEQSSTSKNISVDSLPISNDGAASSLYPWQLTPRMAGGRISEMTCALNDANKVYCWGSNGTSGRLGTGTTSPSFSSTPVAVSLPSTLTFKSVSAGSNAGCAVANTGEAYCWGNNTFGQLGTGVRDTTVTPNAPTKVSAPVGVSWTYVGTGANASCGLSTVGDAYCWGSNTKGMLGDGSAVSTSTTTASQSSIPVKVALPSGVKLSSLSVSDQNACGLTSEGRAYCWGDNNGGQLGNGSSIPSSSSGVSTPVEVLAPAGGPVRFSSISAGYSVSLGASTCAITIDGAAYCWGSNYHGQLGNGTTTEATRPTAVTMPANQKFASISTGGGNSAYGTHTCSVSVTGRAYCWGSNRSGQLATSTNFGINTANPVPVEVTTAPSGTVFQALTTGWFHTCAVTTAKTAYCWGNNTSGELGNTTNIGSGSGSPNLNTTNNSSFAPLLVSGDLAY